jgi:hypothetical protein
MDIFRVWFPPFCDRAGPAFSLCGANSRLGFYPASLCTAGVFVISMPLPDHRQNLEKIRNPNSGGTQMYQYKYI